MGEVFLLSQTQLNMIKRHFPTPRGMPRVDDLRVISGIIYVIRQGLQWKDAPVVYGPHKTLYTRFVRWSRAGIFNVIFRELAKSAEARQGVMIGATYPKAHRTAASLLKKWRFPRVLGARKAV